MLDATRRVVLATFLCRVAERPLDGARLRLSILRLQLLSGTRQHHLCTNEAPLGY